jgi:hypothetical protein
MRSHCEHKDAVPCTAAPEFIDLSGPWDVLLCAEHAEELGVDTALADHEGAADVDA